MRACLCVYMCVCVYVCAHLSSVLALCMWVCVRVCVADLCVVFQAVTFCVISRLALPAHRGPLVATL